MRFDKRFSAVVTIAISSIIAAGCGSSGSSTTAAAGSGSLARFQSCLKSHGVTTGFGGGPGGGAGGAPTGAPPTGAGAAGAPPAGAGAAGAGGARSVQTPAQQQAFAACQQYMPTGGFGGGRGGFRGSNVTAAQRTQINACLKQAGATVPTFGRRGTGTTAAPRTQLTAKQMTAIRTCDTAAGLQQGGPGGGAPGGQGGPGGAGAPPAGGPAA